MAYRLIGQNYTPPDVKAKVTGKAKFAEDFRVDGMAFCKLLLSPMPHAKVRNIDASEALKMKGVLGVVTANDIKNPPPPHNKILTNEPLYVGEPILAVAAETETIAADAVDKIKVDLQPLPFALDPLDSLHPGTPVIRPGGNVSNRGLKLQTVKWSARDFAKAGEGELPMGKPAETFTYGDLEKGFKEAKLVLEESFTTASYGHHCMETRSNLAYWKGPRVFVHASTQSSTFPLPFIAKMIGVKPHMVVLISENCGGGFGSKGAAYPLMALPAIVSRKVGRPIMLRVTRAEEYYNGSGRGSFQGRVKIGFKADGRISALDIYVITDNGPYQGFPDFRNAGSSCSIMYQPENMRWQGIPVATNTPPRGPQRGPGENQTATALEPIIDKAARKLGIDRVRIRQINAPDNDGKIFNFRAKKRVPLTSAYLKDALDKGAKDFNWAERMKRSGKRNGSKVTGIGVGQAYHQGGFWGWDGIVRITPDGKLHLHSGAGNLGTYSYSDTTRVAAEVLGYDWKNCVVHHGDTRKGLPFLIGQFASNTAYTATRVNWVAAQDAKKKLLEIAAKDMGGKPGDYELKNERVVAKGNASKSMSFGDLAKRAIALGGEYVGKYKGGGPKGVKPPTKGALKVIGGSGLIGVAKDTLPQKGVPPALTTAFVEIELDVETGKFTIKDYLGVADCGTALHPKSLETQIRGGAVMGIGMACLERYVYDPKNGRPANRGYYQAKPASYLDVNTEMKASWVGKPDRVNPVGVKGVGEPVQGAAAAAVLCAISDAMGGHIFNRTPVTPDMIVNALAGKPQSYKHLQVHTQ